MGRRRREPWARAATIGAAIAALASGCAPHLKVSVSPAAIDREHAPRVWYVRVVQDRASGLRVQHSGVVCDDKPAIITLRVSCPEEVQLSGEVWRLPDRTWCGGPGPVFPVETVSGATRIARLKPRVLFRGRRGECRAGHDVTVSLWPPVDSSALARKLWMIDDYWLPPEETPYLLEAPTD